MKIDFAHERISKVAPGHSRRGIRSGSGFPDMRQSRSQGRVIALTRSSAVIAAYSAGSGAPVATTSPDHVARRRFARSRRAASESAMREI
jgi:hypothetical protein